MDVRRLGSVVHKNDLGASMKDLLAFAFFLLSMLAILAVFGR